ncbi:helix-turn-helix transcriptional regulator [Microbacterium sp. YY-01]|uniref:helix-turn-helix transcriptional regulator n=1 Tax=Microbacterium sp. YY-01 TaxID=3421634 RepID=UPI003D1636EB
MLKNIVSKSPANVPVTTDVRLSLTLDEAQKATGVSRSIIEQAIRNNDLIARYPSSRPVIRVADLDEWLKSRPTERPVK